MRREPQLGKCLHKIRLHWGGVTKGYTQLEAAGCQPGLRAAEWTKERLGGRGRGGGCFFLLLNFFFFGKFEVERSFVHVCGRQAQKLRFPLCMCVSI